MRKIVFSFDDGLQDFVDNALPIFEKYGFKASINVITRYSEMTEFDGFKYMNTETLKSLKSNGYELACHSDSHLKNTTIDDFDISRLKMIAIFGDEQYGAILPYSQKINNDIYDYLKDKFIYLADYPHQRRKNNLYYYYSYFLGRLFKCKKLLFYYRNYSYFYQIRTKFYTFRRLPIKKEFNANIYIDFLKHMPNNTNLTLMFHSIVKEEEKAAWEEGEWDIHELMALLSFLKKNSRKYVVVVQKEIADE